MTKDYEIIKRPIITEKSNKELEKNKYTFACDKKANKVEIKNAIENIFGVKVVKVNTVTVLPKHKRVGQYSGLTAGYKKAVVTLSADSKKIPGFEL